ncbi:MAG: hypothetical protein AABM42_02345 [Actinomycetota bacterium]
MLIARAPGIANVGRGASARGAVVAGPVPALGLTTQTKLITIIT